MNLDSKQQIQKVINQIVKYEFEWSIKKHKLMK